MRKDRAMTAESYAAPDPGDGHKGWRLRFAPFPFLQAIQRAWDDEKNGRVQPF
jgi:hypothetical protein